MQIDRGGLKGWITMHSKINELIGRSPLSFEDALARIVERANKTLRGVHGLDVIEKSVTITPDGDREYSVRAALRFDMTAPDLLHL